MLGAIIGDIVGSVYEFNNHRSTDFSLFSPNSKFTDDSVLTFATASVILDDGDYAKAYQDFARRYEGRGYGGRFSMWVYQKNPQPYNSFGNGSAMRVSPIGFSNDDVNSVLIEAHRSAEVTHNHPEGIKGAQATALAVFLARKGSSKSEIKDEIQKRFGYDLSRPIEIIHVVNHFDETCQGSVPEAITVFLNANDFEQTIRLAISIGGDSDTIACIAGGIAQAFYGKIPDHMQMQAKTRLSLEFLQILDRFEKKFM